MLCSATCVLVLRLVAANADHLVASLVIMAIYMRLLERERDRHLVEEEERMRHAGGESSRGSRSAPSDESIDTRTPRPQAFGAAPPVYPRTRPDTTSSTRPASHSSRRGEREVNQAARFESDRQSLR